MSSPNQDSNKEQKKSPPRKALNHATFKKITGSEINYNGPSKIYAAEVKGGFEVYWMDQYPGKDAYTDKLQKIITAQYEDKKGKIATLGIFAYGSRVDSNGHDLVNVVQSYEKNKEQYPRRAYVSMMNPQKIEGSADSKLLYRYKRINLLCDVLNDHIQEDLKNNPNKKKSSFTVPNDWDQTNPELLLSMDKYFTNSNVLKILHNYCISQEYSKEAISSLFNTDRDLFDCFYTCADKLTQDVKIMFGVTTAPAFNLPREEEENNEETETW